MKLFTCTDHDGYYPVGVASIVIADNETEAKHLLEEELKSKSLNGSGFSLNEIEMTEPKAIILDDGDY